MARKENTIVGLDIGTTKICAIIADRGVDGQMEIIGIGKYPSKGLRKGMVVNIESTVESIRNAVKEAELMAGIEIDSVYAGIAGAHIKGINSQGIVAVKSKEVSRVDIDRVIDAAKAVAVPMDRRVLHVLPQEFTIDGQDGIREPLGLSGIRLEGAVHIVTGASSAATNIVKCVNLAGLEVKTIVLEPLASGEATLTPDEKELGVALVDIGGGTTDIAVFRQGSIRHTAVLDVGGSHITNDIAIGLRTPPLEAEKLKRDYGVAYSALVREDGEIQVPSVGGRDSRMLSRKVLSEIIEPRVEEIYRLVDQELIRSGCKDLLASGIVITGGSTIMEGMTELAEEIFELPVHRGIPIGIKGLADIVRSPIYATAVGLVLYGSKDFFSVKGSKDNGHNFFHKTVLKMKEWLTDFF
ncbi:MAG: cell division protein FtsA [Nitrospinae bacterium RIFCSPLOWO2_12_FULL_45_22]|nr:MAG: cell division protein FtsA [Nitrospinae bacterium RIFCSPLOWO2_12_FULL_45_22]